MAAPFFWTSPLTLYWESCSPNNPDFSIEVFLVTWLLLVVLIVPTDPGPGGTIENAETVTAEQRRARGGGCKRNKADRNIAINPLEATRKGNVLIVTILFSFFWQLAIDPLEATRKGDVLIVTILISFFSDNFANKKISKRKCCCWPPKAKGAPFSCTKFRKMPCSWLKWFHPLNWISNLWCGEWFPFDALV